MIAKNGKEVMSVYKDGKLLNSVWAGDKKVWPTKSEVFQFKAVRWFAYHVSSQSLRPIKIDFGDNGKGTNMPVQVRIKYQYGKSRGYYTNYVNIHTFPNPAEEYTVTMSGDFYDLYLAAEGIGDTNGPFGVTSILTPAPSTIKSARRMFSGNALLHEIPSDLFSLSTGITNFQRCFASTGVHSVPQSLFANCAEATAFDACFYQATPDRKGGPIAIPSGLFSNNPEAVSFAKCFGGGAITGGWGGVSSIPSDLFAANKKANDFYGCFEDNRFITEIPAALFDSVVDTNANFEWCFTGDSEVIGFLPPLWERFSRGRACFLSCTKADNYNQVPYLWRSW